MEDKDMLPHDCPVCGGFRGWKLGLMRHYLEDGVKIVHARIEWRGINGGGVIKTGMILRDGKAWHRAA